MFVADYTARIDPATLRVAGVIGVCRYVSRSGWKDISLSEYRELLAHGITVILNFEDESNGWMGGASAGRADANFAADWADSYDYPAWMPIPSSADFDMTLSQWNSAGHAYASTYLDTLRGRGRTEGVYGPWDVLSWCHGIGYGWKWQAGMSTAWDRNANAWTKANGAPDDAHLRQVYQQDIGGEFVDHNTILRLDWMGIDLAQLDDIQSKVNTIWHWLNIYLNDGDPAVPNDVSGLRVNNQIRAILAKPTVTMAPADIQALATQIVASIPHLGTQDEPAIIDALKKFYTPAIQA